MHCLSYPATLSLGVITGDIPAISEGALQLADMLAGLLYAEDIEHHYARMEAYAEPEILGDEWVAEPLPLAALPPPRDTTTPGRHRHPSPRRADVIDRAAGLAPGDPLHSARRFRAKVVEATQASHDALLLQPVRRPLDGRPPARRRARLHARRRDEPRAALRRTRLADAPDRDAPPSPALPAMLRSRPTLTTDPRLGDRAAIEPLRRAGLGDAAIVALAQLVAFLSYQLRVVAGLKAMRASRGDAP